LSNSPPTVVVIEADMPGGGEDEEDGTEREDEDEGKRWRAAVREADGQDGQGVWVSRWA
jgi:hypothetical protein